MLGRTDDALGVLAVDTALQKHPEACNLRGTIYEARGAWRQSLDWYGRAKAAWQMEATSKNRDRGLTLAAKGVAYSQRRLGNYREAEAAYLELLAIAPTADTHFLLAQFYEDAQRAARAQHHAREAAKLDPAHYARPARDLIDKLVTLHFGCWGVYRAERSP